MTKLNLAKENSANDLRYIPARSTITQSMSPRFPKWLCWTTCFLSLCVALFFSAVGCKSITRARNETRIRNYFGMAAGQTFQDTTIRVALLSQFPVGTPSTSVESSLASRGLGKDGKSRIWRSETNQWSTSHALCCGPYDYNEEWISMRRIIVSFDLDENQKVKQINVESFLYSL
jgi:hypothetical protein